jgi:hypothetical protein
MRLLHRQLESSQVSNTSIRFAWQRDFNQSQQQHRVALSLKRLF